MGYMPKFMEHFNLIFMGLIFTDLILKRYLNYRQTVAISNSYNKVPAPFDKNISLQDHQKAAEYSLTKLRVASVELTFSILLTFAFTFGGGIELIAKKTVLVNFPLSSEVLIIITYILASNIISLPFDWYKTFKVEQKFGFNKMTTGLFISDQIKGIVVGLIIGVPLLYLIFCLMGSLGSTWWIWVWSVLVVFNLLLLVIYPTIIAPIFNKFTPLEDLELKAKIEALLTKCGFQSQGVFVMDGSKRSSHGNAYFTGLGNSKRIVFFDTLLKQLNHDEIIAVLAHELGHFKHKHIVKQMTISFGITLIGLFIYSLLINQAWFYNSLNVQTMNNATGLLLLFILTSTISLPLAPLSSFMSRKNEYEADNFAKENANKDDLISGLVSMYRDNASTLTPDDLYVKFYYSHPPANLRIANLEK